MDVEIIVPVVNAEVLYHQQSAIEEIERMSSSRGYGAETNLRSWRRNLTAINLTGANGYAFSGNSLVAAETANLPRGALVVAVDISFAKARWYAGKHIKPVEQCAQLLKITADGPVPIFESRKKSWARDILGYLATHRTLCAEAGIRVSET